MSINLRFSGLLTTPQLHFMVRTANVGVDPSEATEEAYFKQISSAFAELNVEVKRKKI